MRQNDLVLTRVHLRFSGLRLALYLACSADESRSMSSVANEFKCSREYVSQIMRKAREIQTLPGPSREIAKALPAIEAEAAAMAGIESVAVLIERLKSGRVPAWWPVEVSTALCKRYGIATPLTTLRKASLLENLRRENEPTVAQVERELYQR